MKNIAIIQARMGSSRFPGKVLQNLCGHPLLQWVVEAAQKVELLDEVVVATSTQTSDLPIVEWCQYNQIAYFQGSELDVLQRFYDAAIAYKAKYIVRITADCPLFYPEIASQLLYLVSSNKADYACNILPPTWPDGVDCEAFTFETLKYAYQKAVKLSDREHVTSFIRNNQRLFKVVNVPSIIPGLSQHRWTVDVPEDLEYIEKLIKACKGRISFYQLLKVAHSSNGISQPGSQRNEGFSKSLKEEQISCTEFGTSQKLLDRAFKVIPLGSQTFSKSYIQYPQNTSPMFLTHGQGARVWDVDGNEYIDLVNALLTNILGYCDLDVNWAIQTQLQKGISFSLSTELEIQLAERLCRIIPCAEKVRFGKNGTDVTSAAVRLARAYTERDKIIVCGYHGWQDWYIGTTSRNKGVPKGVSDLSVSVPYNDLNRIEDLLRTETYAALIMEPCNTQAPLEGYLQGVKELCERYGSLLIFDEIITGFRFALGGAQEYFDVIPHLACFGKAMGNGMPISAVVGRSDIMDEMENIFFSGTFGGETLAIAAALETINKIERENVISYLWTVGNNLSVGLDKIIDKLSLENVIKLNGYAPWKIIQFFDYLKTTSFEIKTYFMQEMIKRGILILGSHNISFSCQQLEIEKVLQAYEEVLSSLAECLIEGNLTMHLKSPVIQPLFKVR